VLGGSELVHVTPAVRVYFSCCLLQLGAPFCLIMWSFRQPIKTLLGTRCAAQISRIVNFPDFPLLCVTLCAKVHTRDRRLSLENAEAKHDLTMPARTLSLLFAFYHPRFLLEVVAKTVAAVLPTCA
jgi:hypothetical protein